jgi:hypothetical protein
MEHEIHPSKVALTMLRIEGSPTLKITISGKSTKFVETKYICRRKLDKYGDSRLTNLAEIWTRR